MINLIYRTFAVLMLVSLVVINGASAANQVAAIPIGGNFRTAESFLLLSAPPCAIRVANVDAEIIRSGATKDANGNPIDRETTLAVTLGGNLTNVAVLPDGHVETTPAGINGKSDVSAVTDLINDYIKDDLSRAQDLKKALETAITQAGVDAGFASFDEDYSPICKPVVDLIDNKINELSIKDKDGDGAPDSQEAITDEDGDNKLTFSFSDISKNEVSGDDEVTFSFSDIDATGASNSYALNIQNTFGVDMDNVIVFANDAYGLVNEYIELGSIGSGDFEEVVFSIPSNVISNNIPVDVYIMADTRDGQISYPISFMINEDGVGYKVEPVSEFTYLNEADFEGFSSVGSKDEVGGASFGVQSIIGGGSGLQGTQSFMPTSGGTASQVYGVGLPAVGSQYSSGGGYFNFNIGR